MQAPAASPTRERSTAPATPAPRCYVCQATDDLIVAYRYWDESLPPAAGKVSKYLCNDGRRCCRRIDRKHAAELDTAPLFAPAAYCLLCGAPVEPNGRYPYPVGGVVLAYCAACDQRLPTAHKLLALAIVLDEVA